MINNKKYIGQSKNIEYRWKEHIKKLNSDKHINNHLQNAWNTYGASGFTFSILELCTKEELTKQEDYWMKYYNTLNREQGYNLREAGPTGSFRKESRERMRQAQIGNNVGEKNSAAVITEEEAKEIIRLLLNKYSIAKVAKRMNVAWKIVWRIKTKESWMHLTKDIEFPCLESSKYLGISYDKGYKKWVAMLSCNKKRVYLEYFDNEIEAVKARDKKAKEYFGDKAKLNFPD